MGSEAISRILRWVQTSTDVQVPRFFSAFFVPLIWFRHPKQPPGMYKDPVNNKVNCHFFFIKGIKELAVLGVMIKRGR